MNHYTYYSYEEYGMGYIGVRSTELLPEEDPYMGSFADESFNPTNKIIIEIYNTREDANRDEIFLQEYFEVVVNPHFANRCVSSSTGFNTHGYRFNHKDNKNYFKPKSPEHRKKLQEIQRRRNAMSKTPEAIEKRRQKLLGTKHSEERRRSQSERMKGVKRGPYKKKFST